MKEAREPSEMPEFYDPELAQELSSPSVSTGHSRPHGLSREEIEMVTKMAEQLSENLKKGIYKW